MINIIYCFYSLVDRAPKTTTMQDPIWKEIEARKYKVNPFDKRFVDLTTSAVTGFNHLQDGDVDELDEVTRNIRARADIISCQISQLLKEANSIPGDSLDEKADRQPANRNGKQGKSRKEELSSLVETNQHYFASEHTVDAAKALLCRQFHEGNLTHIPKSILQTRLLWVEELANSAVGTNLQSIVAPFCINTRNPSQVAFQCISVSAGGGSSDDPINAKEVGEVVEGVDTSLFRTGPDLLSDM